MAILILSMHPEDQYAIRVLKAGTSGYLTKESAAEQLIAAIRKVASGGRFVSAALAEKLRVLSRTQSRSFPRITCCPSANSGHAHAGRGQEADRDC